MEDQQATQVLDDDSIPQQQVDQQITSTTSTPKKKWLIIGIIASVVLILSIALFSVLSSLSPQSIAEKYAEAYIFGDICKLQKYSAYDCYEFALRSYDDEEEYFEIMSDHYDEDITSWDDLSKAQRAYADEEFSDEYGDYKVTIEATRVKDISIRKLAEECGYQLDLLEEQGLIDRDDIAEAKEVTLKLKIAGEDTTDRDTGTIYLVRLGFFWKVLARD